MKRVSVRDIAKEAGVSTATVSFALRADARVSGTMKERILKIADELGYEPDERMAALARYRKDSKVKPQPPVLAWLNLDRQHEHLFLYREYVLYWKGASEAAQRLGFRLEKFTATGRTAGNLVEELKTRGVQGILVTPYTNPAIDLPELPLSDFTLVRFGLAQEKPTLHSVTTNHVHNGELAFRKVRERGYRRIGFVSERRLKLPFGAGVFWEQKEDPKSRRIPLLLFPSKDGREQATLLAAWIKKERPDAIITDLPDVPDMVEQLGFHVPEDIALATTSIHDTPIDAGIEQHSEEVGRLALLSLVSLMNEQHQGVASVRNQLLVEGEWVDGGMLPSRIPGKECLGPRPRKDAVQTPKFPQATVHLDPAGRRVTQRDIAAAQGVSHMTVSLALRNDPRVSEPTRARIQEKAAQMGYRPDPVLSAMVHCSRSSDETSVKAELAWFNLWGEPSQLYAYREFDGYWNGAVEAARRHGYRLEEYIVKEMPLPRLDHILKSRNIRGILVPPSPLPGMGGLDQFPWSDYTVVRLGVTCPVSLPWSVGPDDAANSVLALEKIREKGYRRIAYVGDQSVLRTFGATFFWAQRSLPELQRMQPFYLPLKEPERHRSRLMKWIQTERPDAILSDNGKLPAMLDEMGIRVPQDIALATTTMYDTPINAGIDHHAEEIGRMGIVSLLSHMKEPRLDQSVICSQVHLEGTWVDGRMLPPCESSFA